MAKNSGGTKSVGPIKVRLKDSYGEYGEEVTIYGNAKSVKYDEFFQRFTPVVDKRGLSVLEVPDSSMGLIDTSSKEYLVGTYNDYKSNKKSGYNVDDDAFTFITTNGKGYYVGMGDPLPKIKMENVIYIEYQGAAEHSIWYNKKAKNYKEHIKKHTDITVL